jgi:hypothetical protein
MPGVLPRFLALAAAAAVPLALTATAVPAHASTTSWKVVNPASDSRFHSATTGAVTIKNAAGKTLVTCTGLTQHGTITSRTAPGSTLDLGQADTIVPPAPAGSQCTRPDGDPAIVFGVSTIGSHVSYSATGYNPATGTTTLKGQASAIGVPVGSDDCTFVFTDIAATYNNATRTLTFSSATAKEGTFAYNGNKTCADVNGTGEPITFTGAEFVFEQGVTITRTVT